jgi:hypothetical protein
MSCDFYLAHTIWTMQFLVFQLNVPETVKKYCVLVCESRLLLQLPILINAEKALTRRKGT